MVEMLGVLAIVGVLSVGGVYGYGVAMKKHKANELLHQASMLAATVSAQIESLGGDLPETITDFGSTNYGKFSTSVTQTEDKKKFVLTIENVDSSVCDQLKEGGMVQGVDCKEGASDGKKNAEITYYKNLATNPAEGEKSPTGGKPCTDCSCGEYVSAHPCECDPCFNSELGSECTGAISDACLCEQYSCYFSTCPGYDPCKCEGSDSPDCIKERCKTDKCSSEDCEGYDSPECIEERCKTNSCSNTNCEGYEPCLCEGVCSTNCPQYDPCMCEGMCD
jgi:type II secretory pathway pseudopilin PulG